MSDYSALYNPILGWFSYNGCTVMQHKDICIYIEKLIYNIQPQQVIEIGTSQGGLTMLIRDTLNNAGLINTTLTTYDIIENKNDKLKNTANIVSITKNIFKNENGKYNLICDEVKNNMVNGGRAIIFIDGGNKKAEFNCLAEFIKTGDVILAHDYIDTKENFILKYKDKIWNWCEVTEEDIKDSCIRYGLQPYLQEDMEKVVWACRIKQ